MDPIEQYVELVCWSIGGSRSLRQHVRRELLEHLRDAAAGHRAAGLSEAEALNRAIADFGGPEEVRSELEATHGHRLLPILIDKALQWKEMTMRARWLWATWAYVAVVLLIALQVFFLVFQSIYLLPKMKFLRHYGLLDFDPQGSEVTDWFMNLLHNVDWAVMHLFWLLLGALTLWGLFEWRVRSESKPYMRFGALGTIALGLMVVVCVSAAACVLPFMLNAPAIFKGIPAAYARVEAVHQNAKALEEALSGNSLDAMEAHARRALDNSADLPRFDTILAAMPVRKGTTRLVDVQLRLKRGHEHLLQALSAIERKDVEAARSAMKLFRAEFDPLRQSLNHDGR